MKILGVLTLVAVACASTNDDKAINPVYGYISNIGIPLAEKILEAETKAAIQDKDNGPSKIIGGTHATLAKIPYQAGLLGSYNGFSGRGICGGSLVKADRVITAAHCWFDGQNQANEFEVVLGSTTLFSGGTRLTTTNVVVHPNWSPSEIRNDVAVVYLPSSVSFSDTIMPISLPSGSELTETFVGEKAIASGFGLTSQNGNIPANQSLSYVQLSIISNSICRFAFPFLLSSSNICTSSLGNVSTCRGDSGGPLVVYRNNRNILIGITSFGSGFGCESRLPAAYTRISSFINFFNDL